MVVGTAALLTAPVASASGGSPDQSFGNGGHAIAVLKGFSRREALFLEVISARAPDGRLYVATHHGAAGTVVAFDGNGKLDRGFGQKGRLKLRAPEGNPLSIGAIAVDAQGRLLVAGEAAIPFGAAQLFFVERYLADGSLDPTLGGVGYVARVPTYVAADGSAAPGTPVATGVAVDPLGRIVAAASAFPTGEPPCPLGSAYIARFSENGAIDATFGSGGAVGFPSAALAEPVDFGLTAEGAPVLGGASESCSSGSVPEPAVDRLTVNGAPDPTFGAAGRAHVRTFPEEFAIGPDGELFVLEGHGRIFKLAADGARDLSFDHDALAELAVHSGLEGIVAAPGGGVFVVGSERIGGHSSGEPEHHILALARLDRRGRLVKGFGEEGVVRTSLGRRTDVAGAQVLFDGRGHVVVAATVKGPKNPAALALFQYSLKR